MIKRFLDLNEYEIEQVQLYINRIDRSNKSIEDIKEGFNNKVYNFGEGVLYYFEESMVCGSVRVVLECVKNIGTSYIHFLSINSDLKNKLLVVDKLIKAGINLAREKGSTNILIGIRDEEMLKIANKLGYRESYSSYNMELKNREIRYLPFELVELSQENRIEYLDVYNRSFSDMPHGSFYELEDVEKCLSNNDSNKYYLVVENRNTIGFLKTEIEDGVGSFDIGLCKEYRGKGYGKRLLETAIHKLNEANADKVTLTIIEKNSVALNIYLKRGFEISNRIGYWIEIN
ncbi:MAG: GNAT family N-acetyltransferase [Clostridium sp.]|uniref:GNAT family N-acetyltransferase n=1 Tax=Clostridium sp. TaxID=1506 RepID=UPI002FC7524F